MNKINQKGVTLLETILVLSLVALIMIGGIKLYNNAKSSSDANIAISEINILGANIRRIYSNQSSYSGIRDSVLIQAKAIPRNMISDDGSEIINTFGREVFVMQIPLAGPGAPREPGFLIGYGGLTRNACYKVATNGTLADVMSNDLRSMTATPIYYSKGLTFTEAAELCNPIMFEPGARGGGMLFFHFNS